MAPPTTKPCAPRAQDTLYTGSGPLRSYFKGSFINGEPFSNPAP